MRKVLLVATFAVVALSSLLKCEAKGFFFFPLRFDYNQDKDSDHATKTVMYSSPISGKTYNVDYQSNFGGWQPPPGPSPFPMSKTFNFDANWLFNKGHGQPVEVTTRKPLPPISFPVHPFLKTWRWDTNWNFNKNMGHNFDFNYNINKGQSNNNNNGNNVEVVKQTTTEMPDNSSNPPIFHKTVDIKVTYGKSDQKQPEKPASDTVVKSDDEDDEDEDDKKASDEESKTDIDPITAKKE